jgi:hypothetical protein
MARIRTIKPDFWTNEKVLGLTPLARLMFIGMWNFADDYGRMDYAPLSIKARIFPTDAAISVADVKDMLTELSSQGLIVVYSAKDREYLEVTGWEHQRIDKRQPSKIPGPFDDGSGKFQECSSNNTDHSPTPAAVMEGNGEEGKKIGGAVERAREPEPQKPKSLISEEAFGICTEVLVEMGKHPEDPISVGGPYIVQHWLNGGMTRDAILCGVKTAMIRKKHDPPSTLKYFENAVLRAAAEMSRPLPKVEIREQQTITVNHGTAKTRSGGSLLGSIQRELASVEAQIADLALPGDAVLSIPDRSVRRS